MNVVVTGASSGIGFELVKKLIANKNVERVIGIARRKERLDQLVQFASESGRPDVFVPIAQDIRTLTEEIFTPHLSRVDVLVNNAGKLINKPFAKLTNQDFLSIYEVNVFAPAQLIQLLKPMMGGENASHIVNIGSMGGFQGASKFAGLSAYSSSKSAIAGLTECLAEEFKEDNIKVNCLAFGAVQTEMLEKAFPDFQASLSAKQMAAYVSEFAIKGHIYYNGKVLPVSSSTP